MKKIFTVILFTIGISSYTELIYAQNSITNKVQSGTFNLFREACATAGFNFCSDGYGQPFRMMPYLVLMEDTLNWEKNYEKKVFALFLNIDSLNNFYYINKAWQLDSLFAEKSSIKNQYSFYHKKWKNRVNRYNRINKINNKYDGKLTYNAFKADLVYRHEGMIEIIVPNFDSANKFSLIKTIMVDMYYILDVKNVIPLYR